MEQLLRVRRIEVRRLFGLYDHTVPLHMDDRITIIYGPNGVGKTVLLKLVASLFSGNYLELLRVPYEYFEVELDEQITLCVTHLTQPSMLSEEAEVSDTIIIKQFLGNTQIDEFVFSFSLEKANELSSLIDRQVPWLTRHSPNKFLDMSTGETLTISEAVLSYASELPVAIRRHFMGEPEWLSALRSRVNVYLIETQRLFRTSPFADRQRGARSGRTMTATVRQYAESLKATISTTLAGYANQSQTLDQSFPQRLLNSSQLTMPTDEIKSKLAALDQRRRELSKIGLIDEGKPLNIGELDQVAEAQQPVMALYVMDTEQKLTTLDELAQKISLFLEIVNGKFMHKAVSINRAVGFTAGSEAGIIDLESLSSGEQHELVLTYDLLFNAAKNAFVMIDEPELSLHLIWQKAFLADLARIVKATGIDVLLATHSPFIAADREDLMVALTPESARVECDRSKD